MPWQYLIEKSSGFIQMDLEGIISDDRLDSFLEQIKSDPKFNSARKQLISVQGTGKLVTISLLLELAGTRTSKVRKKVAIVIENERSYIQTQFDQLTRKELPSEIQLFSIEEEALQWLARN